jgi:hypothetical protein
MDIGYAGTSFEFIVKNFTNGTIQMAFPVTVALLSYCVYTTGVSISSIFWSIVQPGKGPSGQEVQHQQVNIDKEFRNDMEITRKNCCKKLKIKCLI